MKDFSNEKRILDMVSLVSVNDSTLGALKTLCRNENVYNAIQNYMTVMSSSAEEASN